MAQRQLQRLNIDQSLLQRLAERGFHTAKDVLTTTSFDLVELLDIPFATADGLRNHVACEVAPAFVTVGSNNNCSMRLDGGVIFIDTEKKFSAHRVVEMACSRLPGLFSGPQHVEPLLSRILLITPDTSTELCRVIERLEAAIIQHRAGIVLLDSIAALARADYGGGARTQVMERQEVLGKQAAQLKYLAETFKIPVLVTNQVTTRIGPSLTALPYEVTRGGAQEAEGVERPAAPPAQGVLTAALGTKWAHCVNTRLILERMGPHRFIKVAKSPAAANEVFAFQLTAKGFEEALQVAVPEALQQSVIDMAILNEIDYGMSDS